MSAKMLIKDTASIFYDADIIIFDNAELIIGNSFINSGCKIRCHKKIVIGDVVLFHMTLQLWIQMHIICLEIIIRNL